jgi:hypothetical protein
MSKILLRTAGVFNILFGFLHILMGILATNYPKDILYLLRVLNVAVGLTVLFFAYVSFWCQRDLLTTRLGKSMLVLMGLFYLVRAFEELIFIKFSLDSLVILIPLFIVGFIYVALLFIPYSGNEREKENEK